MRKTGSSHIETLPELKELTREYIDLAYYDGRDVQFKEPVRVVKSAEKILKSLPSKKYFELPDIYFFIYGELVSISSTLSSSGKLTELLTQEKIAEHQDKITKKLLSYPREYQVFILLPMVHISLDQPLIISDTVSIIKADATLVSRLPIIKWRAVPLRLCEGALYLRFKIKGFFGITMSSSQEKVKSEYKRILASLIATNFLVKGSEIGIGQANMSMPIRTFIYCLNDDSEALSFELSLPESNLLQQLYCSNISGDSLRSYFTATNLSTLFHSNPHLQPDERSQIDRVRTSLEWYFEGLISENQTFSFILFCTAVEALLGSEKDQSNITQRLSDRISFLIARSVMEREAIRKDFSDAYDLRSDIIHRGKSKLSRKEVKWLFFVRHSLEEAIRKEMLLLPR